MSIFDILNSRGSRYDKLRDRLINREQSLLACVVFLAVVAIMALAWRCV